jgi:hypothetical protein
LGGENAMNVELLNDCRVKEINFTIEYKPYFDIQREAINFENNLSSIFEQKYTFTNVPTNAPVQESRFILNSLHKRKLLVSQVAATFKGSYEDKKATSSIDTFSKTIRSIYDYIKTTNLDINIFNSTALLEFPVKNIDYRIENDIYSNYIKGVVPENLGGISINIGTNHGYLLFNRVIDAYESREYSGKLADIKDKFTRGSQTVLKISPKLMKLVERGLSCKLIVRVDITKEDELPQRDELFEEITKFTLDNINHNSDKNNLGVENG